MALYRKYRPASFAEVVGQEHVTGPLSTAIDSGRINHAYLFSGPRGCGKTSSARILARSLNCAQGPTSTPCGECNSCKALAPGGTGHMDVLEMDAATHNGIDDMRELRETAYFAPAESRYRVIILDEAHQISSAGFNALLKIVEEPPEHLIFIFATTEPDKMLATIRSRTHNYPFRLLAPPDMRMLLKRVMDDEGVPVEDAVYSLVAQMGGGSPRDSLSIMDQLLSGSGPDGITYERARSALGVTDATLINGAVGAMIAQDRAALFQVVDEVIESGYDPRRFTADLLNHLRDLMLVQAIPDAVERGLVNVSGDTADVLLEQASTIGEVQLTRSADLVNQALLDMRGATSPRLLLEILCARLALPSAGLTIEALAQRLETLERNGGATTANPGGATGGNPGIATSTNKPGYPAATAHDTDAVRDPARGVALQEKWKAKRAAKAQEPAPDQPPAPASAAEPAQATVPAQKSAPAPVSTPAPAPEPSQDSAADPTAAQAPATATNAPAETNRIEEARAARAIMDRNRKQAPQTSANPGPAQPQPQQTATQPAETANGGGADNQPDAGNEKWANILHTLKTEHPEIWIAARTATYRQTAESAGEFAITHATRGLAMFLARAENLTAIEAQLDGQRLVIYVGDEKITTTAAPQPSAPQQTTPQPSKQQPTTNTASQRPTSALEQARAMDAALRAKAQAQPATQAKPRPANPAANQPANQPANQSSDQWDDIPLPEAPTDEGPGPDEWEIEDYQDQLNQGPGQEDHRRPMDIIGEMIDTHLGGKPIK